jgi:hypothetical protein
LIPDGVFVRRSDGALDFRALPPPSDTDVAAVAARIARRVSAVLGGDDIDDAGALDAFTAGLGAALQPLLPRIADGAPVRRRKRDHVITQSSLRCVDTRYRRIGHYETLPHRNRRLYGAWGC